MQCHGRTAGSLNRGRANSPILKPTSFSGDKTGLRGRKLTSPLLFYFSFSLPRLIPIL
jgi:hypothetical protein